LEDGTKISDFAEIKEAANHHFNRLYKLEDMIDSEQEEELLENIPELISNAKNKDLSQPIEKKK
jgi:hypothetical protein